jgi:serine/threonine protein kinase
LNYIGTRSFRAPELLVGNRYYDMKIDVWSAGIVFLKLIYKYINKKVKMFEVNDTKSLSQVIVDLIGDPTATELKEMQATNDLMSSSVNSGMTDTEIMKKRFKKFDQTIKKDVSADCLDLLHKIFQLSPERRVSSQDALLHPFFSDKSLDDNKISSVLTKQSLINRTTETTSPCTNTNIKASNN